MTQEILEYNKRCAKFIGWKETSEQFKMDWVGCKTKERLERLDKQYIPILEKNGDVIFPGFEVIDFVNDWNWIMKVVEEIEKLQSTQVDILGKYCRISSKGIDFQCSSKEDKKESVVKAINQFLIWYNNL